MFYPVVEIPLIIYIVINFIRVYEALKSGIHEQSDDFPNPDSLCDFVTRPRQSAD
jgi:hypothetical protein